MSSIRKKLLDIQNSQFYEGLKEISDSKELSKMSVDERELLAQLLVLYGAQLLAKGDSSVIETFDKAAKISADSSLILYQQGEIFASYSDNIRCLFFAHTAFVRAIELNPSFAEACYADAKVLLQIGLFDGEVHYFVEARQRFEKAWQLAQALASPSFNLAELFWKWGECLTLLGRLAGEPHDYYQALEKFRLADLAGLEDASFFNDYGDALAEAGSLLDQRNYFVEALKFFKKAVKQDPEGFNGWFNKACCLQRICETELDEMLLEESDLSFAKAAQLEPEKSAVWMKWGQLEVALGKYKMDMQIIASSLEKFEKANQLDPNQPLLLYYWAETELFLSTQQEQLDLILAAKNKILKSLEIQPELFETWYLYGVCLNELGHYFEEEEYYLQAIEKFQYGLSLNSRSPLLWYGMALSHYALGELKNQQALIEKSVRFCSRVIDCGGGSVPQFWNDWGVALLKLAEMTDEIQYVEWAIEKFERAVKDGATNLEKDHVDLEWVYHYGCAFDLLGDLTGEPHHFEKAIHILSQVVQLDPQDYHARYNLALAYYHLADILWEIEPYQKSLEQFQWLIEQDPEDSNLHIDYAIALVSFALLIQDHHQPNTEQETYRQAEHHLMHAAALGSYQAYYHLAGLYSLNGLYAQAMHFIEKAQIFNALPSVIDILHDEWLEGLRLTAPFREFFDGFSSQSKDEK